MVFAADDDPAGAGQEGGNVKTRMMAIAMLNALAIAGWAATVRADTTDAMCEAYEHGDKRKNASGECSFSQRQGYVTIRLRNGESLDLSPADKPNVFRDQKGKKVVRKMDGYNHVYKWEHKTINVSFPPPSGHAGSQGHGQGHGPTQHGETPPELRDLIGGRYVGGEVADEMSRRGYHSIRDETSGDDVYSYYKGHGNCVTVRLDGRRHVRSIVAGPDFDCRR